MPFSIEPLSRRFGVALSGADLAAGLTSELRAELLAVWRKHLVVVIRDQHLSPDQLLDLARGYGRLDLAPPFDNERSDLDGYPEIAVVSNVAQNGKPIGGLGSGELSWHSDMTYRAAPPVGCILQAVEIPPEGGNTHFLSMVGALDTLPNDTKREIAALRLIHDAQYTSAGTARQKSEDFARIDHPLIVTDPLSQSDCLLLGRRRQSAVLGMDAEESQGLLDRIWDGLDESDLSITHHWRPGDVLLWANIAVMHRRDAFDAVQRRLLLRTQIASLN